MMMKRHLFVRFWKKTIKKDAENELMIENLVENLGIRTNCENGCFVIKNGHNRAAMF